MKIPGRMIAIAILVPLVMSVPIFGRTWNIFMHVFGAVLFMGNIAVTAVWASLARRDGKPDTMRFASRGIVLTDVIFTTPGAILLLANGGIIGTPYFKAGASWLFVSIGLFLVTVVVWLAALVPLQKRLLDVAYQSAGSVPDQWQLLVRKWFRWGGVATLLPLLTLFLMATKPSLW